MSWHDFHQKPGFFVPFEISSSDGDLLILAFRTPKDKRSRLNPDNLDKFGRGFLELTPFIYNYLAHRELTGLQKVKIKSIEIPFETLPPVNQIKSILQDEDCLKTHEIKIAKNETLLFLLEKPFTFKPEYTISVVNYDAIANDMLAYSKKHFEGVITKDTSQSIYEEISKSFFDALSARGEIPSAEALAAFLSEACPEIEGAKELKEMAHPYIFKYTVEKYKGIKESGDPLLFLQYWYQDAIESGTFSTGDLQRKDLKLYSAAREKAMTGSPPLKLDDYFESLKPEPKKGTPLERKIVALSKIVGVTPAEIVEFIGDFRPSRLQYILSSGARIAKG